MIGGLIVVASTQLSFFETDSKSSNSDSNPLDSIALEEFAGAAVKEEDDLLEKFTTSRLYKEGILLNSNLPLQQHQQKLEH